MISSTVLPDSIQLFFTELREVLGAWGAIPGFSRPEPAACVRLVGRFFLCAAAGRRTMPQ